MDLVEHARTFAIAAHGDQQYGTEPYVTHLDDVVAVLVEFGHTDPSLKASGYLHDVVEDTTTTLNDLGSIGFPVDVVYIVHGVTSVPGPNRKTRNTATYPKIAADIRRIIVKLADRIANSRCGLKTKSGSLYSMYQKEYPAFKSAIYNDNPVVAPMWAELDRIFGVKNGL
jgi:(p)ppGpp synthase/HD superfamily hydrolase